VGVVSGDLDWFEDADRDNWHEDRFLVDEDDGDEPDRAPDYDPFDDPWGPPKEEPDCYACNDAGCRACEPTRWDLVVRRVKDWWSRLWRRRAPVQADDPWEPPF
jgi:hypothetical protein